MKQGVPVERVEAAIVEELRRFIEHGPTPAELERARTVMRAGFIRGLERIGGFGGKADVLASCEVYAGDPGCYRASLGPIATRNPRRPAACRASLARSQGDYTLEVLPQGKFAAAAASAVDRSKGPPVTTNSPTSRSRTCSARGLSNGIPVIVATRPSVPVARVSLLFDAGYVADLGRKPGTSSFTMSLLDEGAGKLDALGIADRVERLGADLMAGSSLDTSFAAVSTLIDQLEPSLQLLADVVRRPSFPDAEIERVRKEWIAGIAAREDEPGCARAARTAAGALRRGPPVRDPVLGLGHGSLDRRAHARGPARVPAPGAAPGQRDHHRHGRGDAGPGAAAARTAVRRLEARARRGAHQALDPRGRRRPRRRAYSCSTGRARSRPRCWSAS